jgi:hypothetical protein
MQICYDGDAFRRVLARVAEPLQQARAVLALTRPECVDPRSAFTIAPPLDEWRVAVLDRVDTREAAGYLKNRVAMRRAGLWSAIAYRRARQGGAVDTEATAAGAAERALDELAAVDKGELTDDDQAAFNDAAIRVNASRWAADSMSAPRLGAGTVSLATAPGEPGQTCVLLVDARHDASAPLARRCTYGIVWLASATRNREANALALAVQPMDAWRELWVFRKGERRLERRTSCRRRRPRPASASPSSPAGCRAASRCWSRARRAAKAATSAASSWSASTASAPSASRATPRRSARSSAGRTGVEAGDGERAVTRQQRSPQRFGRRLLLPCGAGASGAPSPLRSPPSEREGRAPSEPLQCAAGVVGDDVVLLGGIVARDDRARRLGRAQVDRLVRDAGGMKRKSPRFADDARLEASAVARLDPALEHVDRRSRSRGASADRPSRPAG